MADLKYIPLILNIYSQMESSVLGVQQRSYKGQLKTLGYQKIIFNQRMDMLRHQIIFLKKNFSQKLFFL